MEAYRTLEGFVNQGRVRQLGVSNIYDPEMLRWMIAEARVKLEVVQNRCVVTFGLEYEERLMRHLKVVRGKWLGLGQ